MSGRIRARAATLLLAQQEAAPDLTRCMSALIVMAWRKSSVERDLAVVTEVERRVDGQLGTTADAALP